MTLNVVDGGNGNFAVVSSLRGETIRTYPSKAAAWHHAIWGPFNAAGFIPEMGPNGYWMKSNNPHREGGLTSDPRTARGIRREDASPEQIKEAEKAVARFIQAHISDDPMEVFLPDPEPDEATDTQTPENEAESAAESLSDPSEGNHTADDVEAVRTALSDSQRNALDNFRHMAENAPSESARAYWQRKADDVAKGR